MDCQATPTATLFGTSVVTTSDVSTIVSTELVTVIIDGINVRTTCIPTLVGSSSTSCVPTVITSQFGSSSVRTNLFTTFQTVSGVRTVTSPTQTLFTTSCAQSPDPITPNPVTVTTTAPGETERVRPTPTPTPTSTPSSTSTTPGFVAPVTITSTSTSTDPSGNLIVSTIAIVSTPSPVPTQSSEGSGGPNTAIIGGAVGGTVGLIALIAFIWFIFYKYLSGRQDDIWDEDEGHHAGAAEVKQARPAAGDNGSSPNAYVYGVVGGGTPSPLLRADQLSGGHSHSRSVSTVAGYADHIRSNSQTPLISATSPPHSPPNSPPSLHQHPLPGPGASLDRTRTPVWASPAAQQGYFQQGYPPIPHDPNFTPTVTSTYSANSRTTSTTTSSTQGLLGGYIPPTHTAANPAVAYPPGAAPPRRSTYTEYHKPTLEGRPPSSQRQQAEPSGSTTNLVVDDSASVLTPSVKDRRIDKSGLNGAPMSQTEPSHRTSLISVAPGAPKMSTHPPIVEDAPPAYQQ